ncbi:DNA polymerase III subunit delta' [Clostridium botulinum]|uniref:DNA polymerase III subunit delta' n=1 Tax=Clostridium botulinum C/D str. DC5 TaxID=1443128 RepID=A0A0A0IAC5_CLOBO|nr:DNA polymerase III subunit delta' [Clostridium botulinum]KEI06746.1 DNA polymerase III subunit delta' [Clostridium botulinum C/D str. BKT75002]KEI10856.1 DNA polymerase III subunit delta' [Clostridium botulinum C/D str. BKT2873]KGM93513.1 DNA polymerase III subunit delta' [Clostridium botulinum D str. CCUG 7971]KGM97877.1 DNA polymerase III subunit delta' [Clostridium botulinum C/D str. DC5]KOC49224.1 DNA polymerase III subunit delta' [Clostridium botulinum]
MSFENIIGHGLIKKEINNSIDSRKFSHAHLIVGEDGIGKSLIAREIALKILGKIEDRDYVDIIQWRVEKNKQSIGVDNIRDIIKEVNKKPYEEDKKVIIVYEAERMTIEAQNAFLKTIEEPPEGVLIILLSSNLELMLETIRSRCQIHKLKRLDFEDMERYIKREYPNLEDNEVRQIIVFSDGIPGRCKIFLEDESFKEIRDTIIKILFMLQKKEKYIIKEYEKFFYKYKNNWEEILSSFTAYIRDIILYKELGSAEIIINIDYIKEIKELSNIYSLKQLNKLINIINGIRDNLDKRVNSALAFDVMLLNMQEV